MAPLCRNRHGARRRGSSRAAGATGQCGDGKNRLSRFAHRRRTYAAGDVGVSRYGAAALAAGRAATADTARPLPRGHRVRAARQRRRRRRGVVAPARGRLAGLGGVLQQRGLSRHVWPRHDRSPCGTASRRRRTGDRSCACASTCSGAGIEVSSIASTSAARWRTCSSASASACSDGASSAPARWWASRSIDRHVGPDQFAHPTQQFAIRVQIGLGHRRAVLRQQYAVPRAVVADGVDDALEQVFDRSTPSR